MQLHISFNATSSLTELVIVSVVIIWLQAKCKIEWKSHLSELLNSFSVIVVYCIKVRSYTYLDIAKFWSMSVSQCKCSAFVCALRIQEVLVDEVWWSTSPAFSNLSLCTRIYLRHIVPSNLCTTCSMAAKWAIRSSRSTIATTIPASAFIYILCLFFCFYDTR